MPELKPVSPLMDGLHVLECFSDHGRTACYYMQRDDSEEQFVLKHISVPESDTKTEALILTGAVADEAGAQAYFADVADDIYREANKLQSLSSHSAVASWSGLQRMPREGVGFDLYLLMPRRKSLQSILQEHSLTQLQAMNFGIDLCNALTVLRDAGYLYLNLKPENVFMDDIGRFMIGDLGLISMENLDFCAVPEHYLNEFSAPELIKLFAEPNETSDIYSLGLLLYYMFNGNQMPFDDGRIRPEKARQQRLRGDILPTPLYADCELAEIISKACNVEPEERWASPAELRQALILYMQRNEVSDQLLVPLPEEPEEPEEEEPVAEPEVAPVEAVEASAAAETILEEAVPVEDIFANELPEEEPPVEEFPEEEFFYEEEPIVSEEEPVEKLSIEKAIDEWSFASVQLIPEEEKPPVEEALPAEEALPVEEVLPIEEVLPLEEEFPVEEELPLEDAIAALEVVSAEIEEVSDMPAMEAVSVQQTPERSESVQTAEEEDDIADEPAEAAPSEEENPDAKLSIEELLASVNVVLSEPIGESAEAPDFEANEASHKDKKPKKKRRKIWIPIVIALAVLAFLGGALFYFYTNWYLVTMVNLAVTERSDTSLAVAYTLNTPDPDLSWECLDTYGNSFAGVKTEGGVCFDALTPGTQYTVSFRSGKLHKLLGTTSVTAATAAQTQIVSFDAAHGANSTTADLRMVVSGPEPEEWTLRYSSSIGDSGEVTFSGHTVQVPSLQLHSMYTFELVAPEDYYFTGATSCTLAVVGDVEAVDLQVVETKEDTLSVTWKSIADDPLTWNVQCVGDGYDETLEANVCAATFHGIKLDTAYTITLSAEGMEEPLSVSLPANASMVTSFAAEALNAGGIEVNWIGADPQPEGGWKVRYVVENDESMSGSVSVPEGNSVTLNGLPAKAEVKVILESADGESLIGNQILSTKTAEAARFAAHELTDEQCRMEAYPRPEMDDWTYDDLSDAADTYDAGKTVVLVLRTDAEFNVEDEEETAIMLALRSESGHVVKYSIANRPWKELWKDGRYLVCMDLPEVNGSHQMELYFNNQCIATRLLTINGHEEAETDE